MKQLPLITLQYKSKEPIAGTREDNIANTNSNIDFSKNNGGLELGKSSGLIVLDFDYDIDGLHKQIYKIAGRSPLIRKGSKGFGAFYRYSGEGKKQFNFKGKTVLDVLGEGTYTVIPPSIHPKTGEPYKWLTKNTLENIDVNTIPYLPTDFTEQVERLINPELNVRTNNIKSKIDKDIREALQFIEPEGYDRWLQVGMALKNSFGDEAFQLWDEWSSKGSSYVAKEMDYKWSSFKSDFSLTSATIYKMAIENGYKPDDTLYTVHRAKKKLRKWKEEGYPVGEFVGINELQDPDNIVWHLRKKEFSVITGRPNSGKSEFLDYLIYNTALNLNYKTFYCSFEKDPAKHIESHLHRYSGKCLEERTEEEDKEAERFVNEHFYFYNHAYQSNKIEDILEKIKDLTSKIDIDIIVIDPFSYLESDNGSSEGNLDHVKRCVNMISKYAKRLDVHIFLVAHPKSFDDKEKWDKEKKKYVPAPLSLYSISGGAVFNNTCDNGILVERFNEETGIRFLKIREQEHDKLGKCLLQYNKNTRRFSSYECEF